MSLVKWDPFREMERSTRRLNRLFGDPLIRFFEEEDYAMWTPRMDVYEDADSLVMKAEMPGINKDEIEINVDNGILTISGEKKRAKEVEEKNAYRLERCYGKFSRSFSLPSSVDTSTVKANYKDGVLEITLLKTEQAKPKKISIN
ncbi:MAG: Hsp20/alpha crystallin family protein [Acidobacteriota bacterium]